MYRAISTDFDAMAANSYLSLSKFRLHEPTETDRTMIVRVKHIDDDLLPVGFLDGTKRALVDIMYKILKELVMKAELCRTLEYRINHMQMFLNESRRIDDVTRQLFCRVRDMLPIHYTYKPANGVLYILREQDKVKVRIEFGKIWNQRAREIHHINTHLLRPLNDTYKAFKESRKIRLTSNNYYESRFNIMIRGSTQTDARLQDLNNELLENTESIDALLVRLRKVRDSLIAQGDAFEAGQRLETRRYITSIVNYLYSDGDAMINFDTWTKYLMFPCQTAMIESASNRSQTGTNTSSTV